MKFTECNEQDKISEELIRQITEEINIQLTVFSVDI